jgi:hypothetical protein
MQRLALITFARNIVMLVHDTCIARGGRYKKIEVHLLDVPVILIKLSNFRVFLNDKNVENVFLCRNKNLHMWCAVR